MLIQPEPDQYLWRYIKPDRIDSFFRGELHFAPLVAFDDLQEAMSPVHSYVLNFMKSHIDRPFDLKRPLNEQDAETMTGTILMWLNVYSFEKKLATTEGITDTKSASEFLFYHTENMGELVKEQIEVQKKYFASCWFVGDSEESSLMWSSYSQPGGIAVRIKYSEFNTVLSEYWKNVDRSSNGIKNIYMGLIKYINHHADYEEWSRLIKEGIPLPFFKQHYFKSENEFRIILERNDNCAFTDFCFLHNALEKLVTYDIILYPGTGPDELLALKAKLPPGKKITIKMSDMDFNNRTRNKMTPIEEMETPPF